MPFDTLPNFPEGGVARSDSGVAGIPPDSIRQALQGTGQDLIGATLRPEDTPAVQAVLGAEVDTLLRDQGHLAPPANATQPPAYTRPDTAPPQPVPGMPDTTPGPSTPEMDFRQRVGKILNKYGGSPEEIAKALVYSNKARTETSQDYSALRRDVNDLTQTVRNLIPTLQGGQPGYRPQGSQTEPHDPNAQRISGDEFLTDPIGKLAPVIEEITNRVMRENILAYSDAQRQVEQKNRFQNLRQEKKAEEEMLGPIMNQVYSENPRLYERLPEDESYLLLLERSKERLEAIKGREFLREMQEQFGGGNGQPVPGQTGGSLPRSTGASSRPGMASQPSDWSNTPAFNRMWKSNEGFSEDRALAEVLRERGFHEDTKLF